MKKWAQFQLKVECAGQELGSINRNLEIANGLAAATEASNRAIEASASVMSASNVIIAEQAARQAAAQEGTNLNTAVFADESSRLSSAHVAIRLGALGNRLRRSSKGWLRRLALTEAADLSWFVGNRIDADRLAL